MKKITLDFDGYWREANKDSIPRQSGIYCVYTCTYNATEHTVSIKKMLYIGESTNVHDRIRAEAALIFKHKPPMNEEYVNNFPYEDTQMSLSGKTKFLTTNFTVKKTI